MGTMALCRGTRFRKEGFSVIVSERALIMRAAPEESFAHAGTRPHIPVRAVTEPDPEVNTRHPCVGAVLKFAHRVGRPAAIDTSTSGTTDVISSMRSAVAKRPTNLPHTIALPDPARNREPTADCTSVQEVHLR
jgi:hypothetical protein